MKKIIIALQDSITEVPASLRRDIRYGTIEAGPLLFLSIWPILALVRVFGLVQPAYIQSTDAILQSSAFVLVLWLLSKFAASAIRSFLYYNAVEEEVEKAIASGDFLRESAVRAYKRFA